MKIIGVINKKGGVGKTTTALALAAGLARKKYKVLAIDMDAQANFSDTVSADHSLMGVFEVLTKQCSVNDAIQKLKDFDVISGDGNLAAADQSLTEVGKEYRLKEALSELVDKYDYVVIDTPPSIGVLTTNALTVSDRIIIAAQADAYSAQGLMQLSSSISTIKKYCNPKLVIDGILLTRYNSRTLLSQHVHDSFETLALQIGTKVYKTTIRENVAIKEAQAVKRSIFDYNNSSNGAEDYKKFLEEVLKEE